jgi:hypothetical protein
MLSNRAAGGKSRTRILPLKPLGFLTFWLLDEISEDCMCGSTPESREPSFQTSLQWMRPQPGGTTEALATRLSFRFQLAGGFHHPQAWVARLAGVLAVAVIDAPAG